MYFKVMAENESFLEEGGVKTAFMDGNGKQHTPIIIYYLDQIFLHLGTQCILFQVDVPSQAKISYCGKQILVDQLSVKQSWSLKVAQTYQTLESMGLPIKKHYQKLLYWATSHGHLGVIQYLFQQDPRIFFRGILPNKVIFDNAF